MRGRARPGAFTLVELLVVVAIIGVLAGIMLPVYARSRREGHKAACASNLHQLALALSNYSADHDGHPPHALHHMNQGYISSPGILLCPGDPEKWGRYGKEWRTLCEIGGEDPDSTVPFPMSYRYLSRIADPRNGAALLARIETTPKAGIIACPCHGEVLKPATRSWPADYTGLVLRARPDGSVVRAHVNTAGYEGNGPKMANLHLYGVPDDW